MHGWFRGWPYRRTYKEGWYDDSDEGRPVCSLQGHRMCAKKEKANWEELLADMVEASVSWFPRWKEGGAGVLCL